MEKAGLGYSFDLIMKKRNNNTNNCYQVIINVFILVTAVQVGSLISATMWDSWPEALKKIILQPNRTLCTHTCRICKNAVVMWTWTNERHMVVQFRSCCIYTVKHLQLRFSWTTLAQTNVIDSCFKIPLVFEDIKQPELNNSEKSKHINKAF